MKKWLALVVILSFICGCGVLSPRAVTPGNPVGFIDPNTGAAFFYAGVKLGQAGQAVGTATGNLPVVGISSAVTAILLILGNSYLKGRKNGK